MRDVTERKADTPALGRIAEERGIRYFLISFVDLFGTMRSKLVPASAIDKVAEAGAGFAGFAGGFDMTPDQPDMLATPDPDSLIQLPWKPEVAWLASDLFMEGEAIAQNPRQVLGRAIAAAAAAGYELRTGVECEFFLVMPDGSAVSDPADTQAKPCYDQQALMRRYDVVAEICDAMVKLGWEPYQNDHEDGNGQFEMNWHYDDALRTADRHAFFKFMVKSIAERHGIRATFMPKPFLHLTGSGCHIHVSLWSAKSGENVFDDGNGALGLSEDAYRFIGGIIHNAEALCAITAPTVNSYKRINAPTTLSGSTWAPNKATYAGNNRTHMVRVPEPGRFEFRLADGAANPYLMQAALLVAGLEGLKEGRSPGKRHDINMYTHGHKVRGAKQLPLNLLDALRHLEKSKVMHDGLGADFVASYVKMRKREWDAYSQHLTEWERQNTLDC